jgi:phosphoribosylamine--glycine ligase
VTKLLILDPNGNALDLAVRAKQHGHDVRHFIKDSPKCKWIGDGLVQVVRDYEPFLKWADLIFLADNVKYDAPKFDSYRPFLKAHIVGGTREMAQWELDRSIGMDVLKKHGIKVPVSQEFNSYDKAIAFVRANPVRWVSKPSGDADKALSYCSNTPADMIYMLERWKKKGQQRDFILQEFIPGCEMAVGGWYGPSGWATAWCENFEFKKLMDGDMGVATGEQGTVLRYVSRSRLAKMVLEPLTETLEDAGYCGYIDVNCIIDDEGNPWPLEFTMRPGWPTWNIQQELHPGDPVQWLVKLAQGQTPPVTEDLIAIGVVLSIPDYPYSHLTRKEVCGCPVYGLTTALLSHTHFCEVMLCECPADKEGSIVKTRMPSTAGDYVLVMSAAGETVYQAKQTAYRRLKRLTLPNSPMYRTDIGDRLSKQLPKMQRHGFAMGMEFSTAAQL